jgi:hypothetical protein
MLGLGLIAIGTLIANGAHQLRFTALAFFGVALATQLLEGPSIALSLTGPTATAALVAAAVLYVAARDRRYGEDPGWRLWLATVVAAITTAAAFAFLRTTANEEVRITLLGEDPSGVTQEAAAFWLLSSGVAILLTARGAVRGSLGALLMISGTQLLVRLVPGPQFAYTLMLAWLQVVVALAGAFLIVNERAVRET